MARERKIPEKFKGRKIYSISRLQSFQTCEYGYHLNYNKRLRGKGNIYSLLGTCIHECMEEMQFGKMTKIEAMDKFHSKLFELTEVLGYKWISDKVKHNFVKSIEHCINNYNPIDCKVFKSELEFYTEVGGAVLIGYIDGIALNHDETLEVIDYKTSSKYAKKDIDEHGMQLVLYAMAIEQEYGATIHKVKWDMLKYCKVKWKGATKPFKERERFCLRSEVVSKMRTEFKRGLRKLGKTELEIELLLEEAETKNDMSILPQKLTDQFKVENGYIEYDLNEKTRTLLQNFISETVKNIEAKNSNNDSDWKAIEITEKNNFFCSNLCNHKASCKAFKLFMDSISGDSSNPFDRLASESSNKVKVDINNLFG